MDVRRILAACLLACSCATVSAQAPAPLSLEVPNVTGNATEFIVVRAVTTGVNVRWFAKTPGLNVFPADLLKSSLSTVVTAQKDGQYVLVAYTARGDMPSEPAFCTVTVGPKPIEVVPPPGPEPPPVPPPVPVSGKRSIVLIRETADDTPAVGRMIVGLRSGSCAAYMTSKGHTLDMLDIDSVGPDGKPAALIEQFRPEIVGMTLPVLVVADYATLKLISKQTLPPTATAADVVEAVKKAGG
jgi:hypothetical protein